MEEAGSTFPFVKVGFVIIFVLIVAIVWVNVPIIQAIGIVPTPTPVPTRIPTPTPTNTPTPTPTDTPTPTPSPTPTPTPIPPTPTPPVNPADDAIWNQLATCESNGNWHEDTGNGYFGGLQFSQGAWNFVGGSGKPSDASQVEQISRGKLLQNARGWGVWNECSKKLGLN